LGVYKGKLGQESQYTRYQNLEKRENSTWRREELRGCDFLHFKVRVSLAIQFYYSVVHLIVINKPRAVLRELELGQNWKKESW